MKALEGIVHPLVASMRQAAYEQAFSQGCCLAVADVPLLFETGGQDEVDAVAVVSAPPELQQARVLARPGMTPEKFEAILARQVPDADKRRRADFVIDTGVSLQQTKQQVQELVDSLQGRKGEVFSRMQHAKQGTASTAPS